MVLFLSVFSSNDMNIAANEVLNSKSILSVGGQFVCIQLVTSSSLDYMNYKTITVAHGSCVF